MTTPRRFPDPVLEAVDRAKILGVRAGGEHRYTGVWVVVVEGRVFVRSWSDSPRGWFRAFRDQPLGSMQVAEREVAVRARHTRSERAAAAGRHPRLRREVPHEGVGEVGGRVRRAATDAHDPGAGARRVCTVVRLNQMEGRVCSLGSACSDQRHRPELAWPSASAGSMVALVWRHRVPRAAAFAISDYAMDEG